MVRDDFAPSRREIVAKLLARGVARGEIPKDVDIDLVSEIVAGATWYCVLVGATPLTDKHAVRLAERIMSGAIRGGAAKHKAGSQSR
jgi:hypothetical protein